MINFSLWYYLNVLLPYTNLIVYSKYLGSWIQTTVIANEFSSTMNVCIIGFNNHFMTCMLQIGESTIPRILVAWIVFIKAIFSCLMMNFYLTACLRFLMKLGMGPKTERSIHILSTTVELKALLPPWLRALSKFCL